MVHLQLHINRRSNTNGNLQESKEYIVPRKLHISRRNSGMNQVSSQEPTELRLTKDNVYSDKAIILILVQKHLDALRFTMIKSNSMVRPSVRMSRHSTSASKCRKPPNKQL
jgi:hypothetical protein